MSNRPTVTQQFAFSVDEDGDVAGGIEPTEHSVETSLESFGADVDHRERDSRIDRPEAATFGVDDRPEVTATTTGEQGALFADTDADQQTLTGERAAERCLFDTDASDDQPTESADSAPATTDTATATDIRRAAQVSADD